jgi:hypothetical protein
MTSLHVFHVAPNWLMSLRTMQTLMGQSEQLHFTKCENYTERFTDSRLARIYSVLRIYLHSLCAKCTGICRIWFSLVVSGTLQNCLPDVLALFYLQKVHEINPNKFLSARRRSSIGIAKDNALNDRGSIPDREKRFFSSPQHSFRFWGPSSLLSGGG